MLRQRLRKVLPSDSAVDAYESTLADGIKDRCKFTLSNPKYSKRKLTVYALTPKDAKHVDKITAFKEAQFHHSPFNQPNPSAGPLIGCLMEEAWTER